MREVTYRGLAEFGLPLVGRDDPSFPVLAAEIKELPGPRTRESDVSEPAAVLANDSGRAIVALTYLWRSTGQDGRTHTSRFSSFGSSAQTEVLTGRSKVGRDLGTFILPDSRRLITQRGLFGSNLDVLTPEELPRSRGYCGGWGGDGYRVNGETDRSLELVLDLVVLEDGLCVGPDESGLFEALNESLDLQCAAAREAVKALQSGASLGQVFEIVQPLAGRRPPQPVRGKAAHTMPLLMTFGSDAVHRLINESDSDLLAFFERTAQPRSLELRRPR